MYTIEQLKDAVKKSCNLHQVIINLGLMSTGSSYLTISRKITENNIDFSHFDLDNYTVKRKRLRSPEEIFKIGISRETTSILRRALIDSGVEHKCNKCGLVEWLGEKIRLEIDHINGNPLDNNKENLQFLCPNCHTCITQKQYSRKRRNSIMSKCKCGNLKTRTAKICYDCYRKFNQKKHKIIVPDKYTLEKLLEIKPVSKIAIEYNVCPTSVRKWCKKYDLIPKPAGYWQRWYLHNK